MSFASWITVDRAESFIATLESAASSTRADAIAAPPVTGSPTIPTISPAKDLSGSDAQKLCQLFHRLVYLQEFVRCLSGESDPEQCEEDAYDAYCNAHDACTA